MMSTGHIRTVVRGSRCLIMSIAVLAACERPIDASGLERPSPCAEHGAKACEAACQRDDGAACLTASVAHQKRPEKMMDFELRACDLGEPQGCHYYANNFKGGELNDPDKAQEFSRRACEDGVTEACEWLVFDALQSDDRRKMGDPVAAREVWELACAQDPSACGGLADFERLGLGGSEDRAAATRHYRAACDAGSKHGCINLDVEGPEVWLHHANRQILEIRTSPPPRLELLGAMPGQEFNVQVGVCFRSKHYNPQRTEVLEESSSPAIDVAMKSVLADWRARPREPFPEAFNACIAVTYQIRNDRHINVKFSR